MKEDIPVVSQQVIFYKVSNLFLWSLLTLLLFLFTNGC